VTNILSTTKKRQKAKQQKQTKVVVVNHPGGHTQMDVKYQIHLLGNKQKCYVYNFIDHASNWSIKYLYPAYNAAIVFQVMNLGQIVRFN